VVAGHLAGLAGSLAFDLRDEGKALAYFKVAVQAADDADSAGPTVRSSMPSRQVAGSPTTSSTGPGWPASGAPATFCSASPRQPRRP
jgi:hypothetical protein